MKRKNRQKTSSTPAVDAQTQALERFRALLAPQEYERLLQALAVPLRPAIRLNPLKVDFEAGEFPAALQRRYDWQIEAIPFCDTGWWLTHAATPAGKTIEHRLGHYYIQDAASMLPVELFDFDTAPSQPLILDMASSPGGKTTHLIARSGDRGLVVANDSSRERITALKLVLQTWGGLHCAVTQFPGEKFGAWYPDTFDRVLLDAPCSMESLHSTESHPMRPISGRERSHLARRQARLLESAVRAVKCGGQVVYATCTLAPEEDEAVLDRLLKQYPGAVEIVDVQQHLPAPAPAMHDYLGKAFDEQIRHAVRLYPHICGTSGFFAALIRKKAPVEGPLLPLPQQPFERTGLEALSRNELQRLFDEFRRDYGFELEAEMEEQQLSLWRRAGSILAVPRLYLERFPGLACHYLGLPLADIGPSGTTISHDWALRFGARCKDIYRLADEYVDGWLRGEDAPLQDAAADSPPVVIVADGAGRLLGRGRLQQKRLKNLLPRRLLS